MAKAEERLQARRLRLLGESIGVIARKVGVSKGSVSLWCSDIELSPRQTAALIKREGYGSAKGRQIAAKLKKIERKQRMEKFGGIGSRKIGRLSNRELFLIGAALYWAEGSKKNRQVVFTNSDPAMILIYLAWLKRCLYINQDRIFCRVGINQEHKKRVEEIEQFWSKTTGISRDEFSNTTLRRVKMKKYYENASTYYGTLAVKVRCSTNLNYEILGYIEALKLAA